MEPKVKKDQLNFVEIVPEIPKNAPECKKCGMVFKTKHTYNKHLKTKKHKINTTPLPDMLIGIPNPDKGYHESWTKGRNKLNIPHPFRAVLSGSVNCGKTTVIKNIFVRADPPFEALTVIHCDAQYTKEYEDCNAEMLSHIPKPEEWDGVLKRLVVLDDIDYQGLSKEQQSNLDRLLGFCSTHKNISVCITCQDYFRLAPSVKRMANFFIIWRSNDQDSFKMISRKCGIPMDKFMEYFDSFSEARDSLWVDLTDKTPYKIRKNGFELLE